MSKIKLDHTTLGHPAFIVRMREIRTALTGNPAFAAVALRLPPLDAVVDTLETRDTTHTATVQLAEQQLTELNTARDVVEDTIRALASASEAETTDDAELLSGGWHLIDPPTPPGPMSAPDNLVPTGGDLEGEVDLAWEPVGGRDAYLADWAADPAGPWTQFYVGTKSSCTASGLNPGQMYYFRVRAVGPLGPGPWSDIAQKRAS
jgi:hypothetical protein